MMTVAGFPIDTRLLAYGIWGFGCVALFGVVLLRRARAYRYHHDARGRRDLIEAIALFTVSLASFLAITFVLFGEAGTGIRGMMAGIALGAFFGLGLVMVSEKPHETIPQREARR